jgi:prepilin-type N-terminal cleavage/methylation domain-containing protein
MKTYRVLRNADCGLLSQIPNGFSLVEVMLAVGIVAFAVVGVLTAFPVGIEAARDARDETTAALIADDIFSRMRSQSFNKVMVPYQGAFKQVNLGAASLPGWVGSKQGDPMMFYYARDGRPANSASGGAIGGSPSVGSTVKGDEAYFGAQVYVLKQTWTGNFSPSAWPGLARVSVQISWPARTPFDNRTPGHKRMFDTLIARLQ